MHPAGSLIAFTTASGFGFGLLAFLGAGLPPATGWTLIALYGLGLGLAGAGLAASALHLGHPERALLAFTQWRTSWLSREAWAAAAALSAAALAALAALATGGRLAPIGWLSSALALATVGATSMIYAQLRTVPRWHHWSTPALFVAYALAGGALLSGQGSAAVILLVAAGFGQFFAWKAGDRRLADSGTDLGTATGLAAAGQLRSFEPPHTGGSYLTREMVHVVARRHALKLRSIGLFLAFVLPVTLLVLSHALPSLAAAAAAHAAGAVVIRWLFFAEAEHVLGLYYGHHTGDADIGIRNRTG
ncbi:MAG: dimethyl sulfoxide reductase anchor subunit family protein [Tranquillimonas sp.]